MFLFLFCWVLKLLTQMYINHQFVKKHTETAPQAQKDSYNMEMVQKENPWVIFPFTSRVFGTPVFLTHCHLGLS